MANSSGDPSDAHINNPAPTSEVGSESLKVVLAEIAAIREQIGTLTQKPKEQAPIVEPQEILRPPFNLENIPLPHFNPELAGSDPVAWCATVSVL
jgi:hypothetical protein